MTESSQHIQPTSVERPPAVRPQSNTATICIFGASGDLTALEWNLYQSWYYAFASQLPIAGILYINTGVNTAYERIKHRARVGEDTISKEYLEALDKQHRAWIANTRLSKQEISTETGTDMIKTMNTLEEFFDRT